MRYCALRMYVCTAFTVMSLQRSKCFVLLECGITCCPLRGLAGMKTNGQTQRSQAQPGLANLHHCVRNGRDIRVDS